MTDNANGNQEAQEKKEDNAQPQEDMSMEGAQSQPKNSMKPEQPVNNTTDDCVISQVGESGAPSQCKENKKCKLDCKILIPVLALIVGFIVGFIVFKCWDSVVGICLAVFLCICAYKCLQKDKLSCTISWLVGLSLQFILIIVIGLFVNTYSGFSVTVQKICILNESTITLTSVLLFILSIPISILSGRIVYQIDEEKKQKQQNIERKKEELNNILKEIYREGNANG